MGSDLVFRKQLVRERSPLLWLKWSDRISGVIPTPFPCPWLSFHPSKSIQIAFTECDRARANSNCPERPLSLWGVPWGYHGTNLYLPWYHRSMAGASSLSCCGTLILSPPAIVNPTLPCPLCQSRSVKPSKASDRAGGQPPTLSGGAAGSNGKTSRKPAPACANPSLMPPCYSATANKL